MKLHNLNKILGTITDGHAWHTIKFFRGNEGLQVKKYVALCSLDERKIIGSLSQLMDITG